MCWYEYGEKPTKFFLNLEKTRAHQNKIKNLLINGNEMTDQKEVNNELFIFYNNLFKNDKRSSKYDTSQFLSSIQVPCLTEGQSANCEFLISELELICALKNMPKNKSPGNDGLTKELYETFWDELKIPFIASLRKSFLKEELSNSQKQAVIRLIEKKDKDKRYIQKWRPLTLRNTDVKSLSKKSTQRLKKTLSFLISANQSASVDGRFISKGGKLISDLLEISDTLKLDGLLATIDIQKAFDSVDHAFIISTLERYGFGNKFVRWVKILLKNQESCIINGGNTTKYFKLEKGTGQGDPISAYLFILVLEILFLCIENKNIKGLNIFNHIFLYIAYADDTTFFLKDKESLIEVMKAFDIFSSFSGLKPNKSKCEVAGIGALKEAENGTLWYEMY